MRKISHALGWLVACAVALSGCSADYSRLEPTRPLSPASSLTFEQSSGIGLVANSDAWRGSEALSRELLVIELAIENRSGGTIYVTHQDVSLIGISRVMPALSPRSIRLKFQPVTMGLSPTEIEPESGNAAAPPPPTPEESAEADLREEALGEGPIEDRESVRGFVYFDRLPKDVQHVDLRVIARERSGGRVVAVVVVPFDVRR